MSCSLNRRNIIGQAAQSALDINPSLTYKQFIAANPSITNAEKPFAKQIFKQRQKMHNIDYVNTEFLQASRNFFTRKFITSRSALKHAVDSAKKAGFNITEDNDTFQKLTLELGKVIRKIEAVTDKITKGENSWTNRILREMPFEDFDMYVKAKHAIERNLRGKEMYDKWWTEKKSYYYTLYANETDPKKKTKILRKINEHRLLEFNAPINKGGMTNTEANDILSDPKYVGKENIIRDFYTEFKEQILDRRIEIEYEIGRLTRQQADSLKRGESQGLTSFEWYIPLEVDFDVLTRTALDGTPKTSSTSKIRSLKRSEGFQMTERSNPWATGLARYRAGEMLLERNNTMKSLKSFIQKVGDKTVKISKVPMKVKVDAFGNFKGAKDVRAPHRIANSLYFYENGKRYVMEFQTKDNSLHPLVSAFRLHPNFIPLFTPFIKPKVDSINNYLRSIFTTSNPFFAFRNFFRDFFAANIELEALIDEYDIRDNVRLNYMKKIPGAFKVLTKYYTARSSMSAAELKRIEDFKNSGAPITFSRYEGFSRDIDNLNKQLEKAVDETPESILNLPKETAKNLLKAFENFNDIFELTNRMAVYESLKEEGLTDQQAAFESRRMADFEDKGEYAPTIGTAYLFFNAGMKGIERTFRTAKNPKALGKLVGILAGLGFTLAAMSHMLEDEECATIRNEIKRDNNLLIPMGGCKYLTLPKPYSAFRLPFFTGEYLADVIFGKESLSPTIFLGKSFLELLKMIDPIGFSDQTTNLAPTFLRPLVQAVSNDSWAGSEIVPNFWANDKYKPFDEKTFDTDSFASKELSSLLNKVDFLNSRNPNYLSPIALDYVFNSYFNAGFIKDVNDLFINGKLKVERKVKKATGTEIVEKDIENILEFLIEKSAGHDVKLKDPNKKFQSIQKNAPLLRNFYSDEESNERVLRYLIEDILNETPPENLTKDQYEFMLKNIDKIKASERRVQTIRNSIQTKYNTKIKEFKLKNIGKDQSKPKTNNSRTTGRGSDRGSTESRGRG